MAYSEFMPTNPPEIVRPTPGLDYVTSPEFQSRGEAETQRWNKEWMRYFSSEKDYRFYFYDMDTPHYALTKTPEQMAAMGPREFYYTKLYRNVGAGVWANGADFVGRDVFEMGCGPGILGRMASRFVQSYTGVDVSTFALSIARLTSPAQCRYLHLYDGEPLRTLVNQFDTVYGRNFFIHHNYADSVWILRLLVDLVRPGGVILADFFSDHASLDGDRRVPAKYELRDAYPSALFSFTDADIHELAGELHLHVESIEHVPELSCRFVRLRKQVNI